MRITFRKKPRDRWVEEKYTITVDGEKLATIQALRNGGYFWYGDGINTAREPATLDRCKQQIREHFTAKAKGERS